MDRMSSARCCCIDCVFVDDSFDNGLGGWTVTPAGGLTVINGEAVATIAPVQAIAVTPHPSGVAAMRVDVYFYISGFGGKLRAIAGYEDDSNFIYADLTLNATQLILDVYRREGGVDTLLSTETETVAAGDLAAYQNFDLLRLLTLCYVHYEPESSSSSSSSSPSSSSSSLSSSSQSSSSASSSSISSSLSSVSSVSSSSISTSVSISVSISISIESSLSSSSSASSLSSTRSVSSFSSFSQSSLSSSSSS